MSSLGLDRVVSSLLGAGLGVGDAAAPTIVLVIATESAGRLNPSM